MPEENINIAEKSESIKHDIEDCYRGAIKYLELYNNALMRHAGNHRIYYSFFVSKFQSLYYFTRVDGDMKRETIERVSENLKNEDIIKEGKKEYELLLPAVGNWLNNGVTSDHKKGIELFLQYGNALFDRSILSYKK